MPPRPSIYDVYINSLELWQVKHLQHSNVLQHSLHGSPIKVENLKGIFSSPKWPIMCQVGWYQLIRRIIPVGSRKSVIFPECRLHLWYAYLLAKDKGPKPRYWSATLWTDWLKAIYFAFVYPYLLYGIEIYANTFITYLDKLMKLIIKSWELFKINLYVHIF